MWIEGVCWINVHFHLFWKFLFRLTFPFLVPFLREQIIDISIAIRDTRSEVAERVVVIINNI